MPDFTKSERAKLTELAGAAYERELGAHLADLGKSFERWRKGKMVSSELANVIHEFHQNAARKVWAAYQLPHPAMIVARALAQGIIERKDVPSALLSKLEKRVETYEGGGRAA